MIDATTFFTIVLMAGVTYLTRIGGYVVLRNRTLSGRATAVMEAAPGCVLIAVIAPAFVSKSPADILALAVTLV
ncbi:AzlD family protein, partial [Mesorhizobium sp.]